MICLYGVYPKVTVRSEQTRLLRGVLRPEAPGPMSPQTDQNLCFRHACKLGVE
jgi:hypothetical protein